MHQSHPHKLMYSAILSIFVYNTINMQAMETLLEKLILSTRSPNLSQQTNNYNLQVTLQKTNLQNTNINPMINIQSHQQNIYQCLDSRGTMSRNFETP